MARAASPLDSPTDTSPPPPPHALCSSHQAWHTNDLTRARSSHSMTERNKMEDGRQHRGGAAERKPLVSIYWLMNQYGFSSTERPPLSGGGGPEYQSLPPGDGPSRQGRR